MRPVSPWTWRRALRDHGPDSPSVLLTLYVIGTYMGRDGIAWPNQQRIAAGARVSVRTVRRHILAAQRMGWLGVELAGRGGQGWRSNRYRAAIPDDLELNDPDELMSDAIVSQVGDIEEREDTILSAGTRNGEDTMLTSRHGTGRSRSEQGEDIRRENVRTSSAEREDTERPNVRTQHCPTNSCSELSLRPHASEEARTSAQSKAQPSQERPPGGAPAKIASLASLQLDLSDDDIAHISGESIDTVRQVRAALERQR